MMDSPFSVHHHSLCTCCDIISRLANEMQSLLHDMESLLEQQITHQSLQTQYNQLLLELKEKMDQISREKLECIEDNNPLEDFEMFVKGIWKKINKYLDKDRRNAKFLSAKRGIPIAVIAEQLLDFCFHCSFTYKNIFLHPHCCEQFNVIFSQLSNVVFPEVQYSDDFEQSQIFVQAATPCLKNLLKIVDKFMSDDKCRSVELVCRTFIENETPSQGSLQPKRIINLLDCVEFLSSSLDEGIPKLKALFTHVDEMTSYILKISAVPRKVTTIAPTRIAGILNSNYMDCIHPAKMSPKMYHVQLNNLTKETPYKCETQRIVGATRRRRRYLDDATTTIRVPKLQMQPFPY